MRPPPGVLYEFGPFQLDPSLPLLTRGELPVQLPPKALETLVALVERGGRVVTREELIDAVWPDTAVEENNLSVNVSLLRRALDSDGEHYIETVPRRGYRFSAPVRKLPAESFDLVYTRHTRSEILIEESSEADAATVLDVTPTASTAAASQVSATTSNRKRLLVAACLLLAVVGVAGTLLRGTRGPGAAPVSAPAVQSVAVLPLKGSAGEDEYLRSGIADVLTTRLSGVRALSVRPVRTAVPNEHDLLDPFLEGRKLQVDAVLTGNVQRLDDRVRVTLQLLRTADESTIWAGQFDEKASDLLVLQDDIAQQVVSALALRLSESESAQLTHRYTDNADAQHLYLRGLYYWNTRREYQRAELFFNLALEKDPDFALAHAGLGQVLATGSETQRAENSIRQALVLDPNLAEAHAALGFLLMFVKWDWNEAEGALKRAIELKTGYAPAHQWLGLLLAVRKRFPEAEAAMHRALAIDPTSANLNASMGQILYLGRDYDRALEYCLKAVNMDPDARFAREHLLSIYLKKGMEAQAVAELAKWHLIGSRMATGQTDEKTSRRVEDASRKGLDALVELRVADLTETDAKSRAPFWVAHAYALSGDRDRTLYWLERAVNQPNHSLSIAFIAVDPNFDHLHNEPRYQAILRTMGLQTVN